MLSCLRLVLTVVVATCTFILAPAAQDWGGLATISNTMGTHSGHICIGEAFRGDIGCPTYAPSILTNGIISATGLTINGVAVSGGGGALDRISTTGVASGANLGAVVADNGTVSFTLGGTAGAAYMHPTLGFVGAGVSTTGTINAPTGYFSTALGIGIPVPTYDFHISASAPDIMLNSFNADVSRSLHLRVDSTNSYINNMNNFVSNGTTSNGILIITGQEGVHLRYGNLGSAGSVGLSLASTGNVGIGNITPTTRLDVSGTIYSRGFDAGSGTTIDYSQGNVIYTSAACGSFTLSGMQDGGAYTLVVKGNGTGPASFTHSGLTVKTNATLTCTASTHTVFSFLRAGTDVYVNMVSGF